MELKIECVLQAQEQIGSKEEQGKKMIKIIRKASKDDLLNHLYDIDLKDQNLYDEINRSTYQIFQFTGNTASRMVSQVKPCNMQDLTSINSLSRPGASYLLEDFIGNADGNHPRYPKQVNDILYESRGMPLFQEQAMRIFNVIGGYSLEKTNYIRALMKKLSKSDKKQSDLDAWDKEVKTFTKGAVKNGLTEKEAQFVANDLKELSSYSFNASHAYAYAYTAVMCLYLTYYFRADYYCAGLNYDASKLDALTKSISSVIDMGFKLLPPNINNSQRGFTPLGNNVILWGFENCKGIGSNSIEAILKNRPYYSIIDFIVKNKNEKTITKRVTEALILSGAFDESINKERRFYKECCQQFYDKKSSIKNKDLYELEWNKIIDSLDKNLYVTTHDDLLEYEETSLGGQFFISIFSDRIKDLIERGYKKGLCCKTLEGLLNSPNSEGMLPVKVESFREHKQKNGQTMMFCNIVTPEGLKISLPIFGSYYEFCKETFEGNGFYLFHLFKNDKGEVMFGSRKYKSNEEKKRMIKKFKEK
jgi:DNA polymerase III alpha subunit